jgi:hypothetical protein
MIEESTILTKPIFQYGFAGFSSILLVIIIWLISKLIDVYKRLIFLIEKTNNVLSTNCNSLNLIMEMNKDIIKLLRDAYELLLSKPCINKKG